MDRYSRQETMIAYWGIGTYWGKAQSNNKKGHLIGHVSSCAGQIPVQVKCKERSCTGVGVMLYELIVMLQRLHSWLV